MKQPAYRYLFGPVPSRRFGLHINEAAKILALLIGRNLICADSRNEEVYYRASA